MVKAAKRDVLFCTAFGLHEKVRTALLGQPKDPILRFGMENKRSEITGYRRLLGDRLPEGGAGGLPRGVVVADLCLQPAEQGPAKEHHLFDSFEGLSEPDPRDGSHWTKGDLAAGEDVVARNLAPFADMLHFWKGWIPERFPEVADRRFSFVHVDVDLYQPTRDSIEFFYDRLNPGGSCSATTTAARPARERPGRGTTS